MLGNTMLHVPRKKFACFSVYRIKDSLFKLGGEPARPFSHAMQISWSVNTIIFAQHD